jgi:hypothetical protein
MAMQNTTHKERYQLAFQYHRQLPDHARDWLHERGISDPTICRYRLGWNGDRITIPITNRDREVVFFKLAKESRGLGLPDLIQSEDQSPEIFGWERVVYGRPQIIICQSEWDRLLLESRGFAAIVSTAAPAVFLPDWAKALEDIPWDFVCSSLIPGCRVVTLPEEVGLGGTLIDYFCRLGKTDEDFNRLLDTSSKPSVA